MKANQQIDKYSLLMHRIKIKSPAIFFMESTKRFVCWFTNVQSVLLWWYYNDTKAYRILAVLRTIQDVGSL